LASKKTKERITLSFIWPIIAADVQKACEVCHQCQKGRRVMVNDRVPINPIPRDEIPFDCLVMDCMGPLFSSQNVEYNYALVICNTRYPFCYGLFVSFQYATGMCSPTFSWRMWVALNRTGQL